MRTISPIYSQNKLEPDINRGKNRAIIFIGAVMAKCNSYVLNYICPPLFPRIFTHVRYQPNFFSVSSNPSYITVQSAARTKTQLMRQKRNKRPLGKWLHCRQLASVYLYLFVFPYCVYLYLYFHTVCICIWFVFYTAAN